MTRRVDLVDKPRVLEGDRRGIREQRAQRVPCAVGRARGRARALEQQRSVRLRRQVLCERDTESAG